ncbi:MAG: hypothetical protein JSV89_21685 [Spirochaetaceae bacterium]|nr:MAG: hypothetical protein JSV89_21685 [Spirochaetaceae bacterium]
MEILHPISLPSRKEEKMTREKGKNVWLVMLILSILFIGWTVFTISNGSTILENGVKMWAGSSFDVKTIEERALGFMNLSMVKPLWEEIWIGIIGIFCALGLKRKMKYAWILGIIWGAMMLVNGIVQGLYEVVILNWSMACPQTYIFLVFGIVILVSLLVARKGFSLDKK